MFNRLKRWLIDKCIGTAAWRAGHAHGYEAGYEKGQQDGFTHGHDHGYSDGIAEGTSEGREQGKVTGHQLGFQEAYAARAKELGLVATEIPAVPLQRSYVDIKKGPHPNVYPHGEKGWVLRLVRNGERERYVCSKHYYVYDNLIDAVGLRDRLTSDYQHGAFVHIMYEVLQTMDLNLEDAHVGWTSHTNRTLTMTPTLGQLSEIGFAFHQRMLSYSGLTARLGEDHPGFFGDDPQDRFPDSDPAFADQPWPAIFEGNCPGRINRAMTKLGLGAAKAKVTDEPRSVRDLLLITAEELQNCHDFGEHSLGQVRAALRKHHLALWGETVPRRPSTERQLRAINLDTEPHEPSP